MQLHSYAETLNVKISADVSKIKESTLRDITFTFNVLSENVITFVIMRLFLKKKIRLIQRKRISFQKRD